MNHSQRIAAQLNLHVEQAAATIELFDAGNTLPFIARYRKERTGGLDEEQLRQLSALLAKLRALEERRRTVLATIEKQGKLTPALRRQLLAAETLTALKDLYRPYKPKRRTRADIAREKGLQGLADLILAQELTTQTIQVYYDFGCRVDRLRPHQILALNRGKAEKVLRVRVEIPERDWLTATTTW